MASTWMPKGKPSLRVSTVQSARPGRTTSVTSTKSADGRRKDDVSAVNWRNPGDVPLNPVDNGALFHRSSGHRDCTQLPLRRVHSLSRDSTVHGISFFKDTCAGTFANPETSFRRINRPASGCQEKAGHRPAWRPTPGPSCAGSRQGRRPAAHRGRGPFSRQYSPFAS